jgi:hypothetical protein
MTTYGHEIVETGTVENESQTHSLDETDDPETSGEVGSNKAGQHEGDSAICFLSILSRLFYMQHVDDSSGIACLVCAC